VGELVAGDRDRFVIATKYTAPTRPGDPNSGGNHRKALVQSLDGSLKRLGTDYVDLYWVHVWEYLTPLEEVMRALDDMVRAGKILYISTCFGPASPGRACPRRWAAARVSPARAGFGNARSRAYGPACTRHWYGSH
jgi:aryl-alcohol dehydrogenase-like predicted oxidoreductase